MLNLPANLSCFRNHHLRHYRKMRRRRKCVIISILISIMLILKVYITLSKPFQPSWTKIMLYNMSNSNETLQDCEGTFCWNGPARWHSSETDCSLEYFTFACGRSPTAILHHNSNNLQRWWALHLENNLKSHKQSRHFFPLIIMHFYINYNPCNSELYTKDKWFKILLCNST